VNPSRHTGGERAPQAYFEGVFTYSPCGIAANNTRHRRKNPEISRHCKPVHGISCFKGNKLTTVGRTRSMELATRTLRENVPKADLALRTATWLVWCGGLVKARKASLLKSF
jgi:hypothetical protein